MGKPTLREAWERSTSPAWMLETAVVLGADLDKVVSLVAAWCALAFQWAGIAEWMTERAAGRVFPVLELQENPRNNDARHKLAVALHVSSGREGSAVESATDAAGGLLSLSMILVGTDEGVGDRMAPTLAPTVAACLAAASRGDGGHPTLVREKLCNDVREAFPLPEDEALTAAGRALAGMALERDRALEERTKAQEALGSHAASALGQIDRLQAKIKSCEEELGKERERVAHLEKERAEEATVRAEAHEQDAANARAEAEKLRTQRDEALEAQRTAEERLAASCTLCGRVLPEEATGAVAEALALPRGTAAADLVLQVQKVLEGRLTACRRFAEEEERGDAARRERDAALELAEQLTEKIRTLEAPAATRPASVPARGALRRLVALEGRLKSQFEALAVEVAQEVRGIHAEYALTLEDAVAKLDGRPVEPPPGQQEG